jgi:hypothetical protein
MGAGILNLLGGAAATIFHQIAQGARSSGWSSSCMGGSGYALVADDVAAYQYQLVLHPIAVVLFQCTW